MPTFCIGGKRLDSLYTASSISTCIATTPGIIWCSDLMCSSIEKKRKFQVWDTYCYNWTLLSDPAHTTMTLGRCVIPTLSLILSKSYRLVYFGDKDYTVQQFKDASSQYEGMPEWTPTILAAVHKAIRAEMSCMSTITETVLAHQHWTIGMY